MNERIKKIWDKAEKCNCSLNGCHPNAHRLCAICDETIFWNAHESNEDQANSRGAWNIDHIKPLSKGGRDIIDNLQAVHIECNRCKGHR